MELVNKGKKCIYIQDLRGGIEYTRTVLAPKYIKDRETFFNLSGQYSTMPLDNYLGVNHLPFHVTLPMMARIASTVVTTKSFQEASRNLKKQGYKKVSTSLVDQISEVVGQAILNYRKIGIDHIRERILNGKKIGPEDVDIHNFYSLNPEKVLLMMMDGHTIYVRKYSTEKYDINDGGKCGCDCRVAIAFKLSDCIIESDDKGGETVRIKNKDMTALICPKDQFQYHFGELAFRNGADDCELIVVVSDGADYIHSITENILSSSVHIRDIWHTKECTGEFCLSMFADDAEKGHELTDKLCKYLDDGKIDDYLEMLKPYENIVINKNGNRLVNPYTYVNQRKDGMEYNLYKKLGLPVGSGAMESTNKTFHRRMRTTGALWTKKKANRFTMMISTNEHGGEELILTILYLMLDELKNIKESIKKDEIHRKYDKT